MTSDSVSHYFSRLRETLEQTEQTSRGEILHCSQLLIAAFRRGNKVLIMGNGGSASDAEHFAAELVGRFLKNRHGLPALALTGNSATVTAVSNDFGFDDLFSRQIEALALPGDLIFAISTSGHSPNINRGLLTARNLGCTSIALLGRDGGEAAGIADCRLIVPVDQTPHIQEAHIAVIHLLCKLVEDALFPTEGSA
jgi:D-sedoheptulose 7-phosphate isomerase